MPVFWRIAASFQLLVVSLICFLFSAEAVVSFLSKSCKLFISSVVIVIISNIIIISQIHFGNNNTQENEGNLFLALLQFTTLLSALRKLYKQNI